MENENIIQNIEDVEDTTILSEEINTETNSSETYDNATVSNIDYDYTYLELVAENQNTTNEILIENFTYLDNLFFIQCFLILSMLIYTFLHFLTERRKI